MNSVDSNKNRSGRRSRRHNRGRGGNQGWMKKLLNATTDVRNTLASGVRSGQIVAFSQLVPLTNSRTSTASGISSPMATQRFNVMQYVAALSLALKSKTPVKAFVIALYTMIANALGMAFTAKQVEQTVSTRLANKPAEMTIAEILKNLFHIRDFGGLTYGALYTAMNNWLNGIDGQGFSFVAPTPLNTRLGVRYYLYNRDLVNQLTARGIKVERWENLPVAVLLFCYNPGNNKLEFVGMESPIAPKNNIGSITVQHDVAPAKATLMIAEAIETGWIDATPLGFKPGTIKTIVVAADFAACDYSKSIASIDGHVKLASGIATAKHTIATTVAKVQTAVARDYSGQGNGGINRHAPVSEVAEPTEEFAFAGVGSPSFGGETPSFDLPEPYLS